ncbi:hypothetical protein ACFY3B_14425 [Micromonospora parva]|uniref:Transketolase-like pyrimidine-binding domain-containing protein n=1 Tax=Micromonospora parva TaxID=1464048 RepID=A0ABW6VT34_9ACTN
MTATVSAREAYRLELTELAADDPRIVCLEADLGGPKHCFQDRFPDRFLNLGIAEASAVDIAVGLASAGLRPFVSTFATFAAFRAGGECQARPRVPRCPRGPGQPVRRGVRRVVRADPPLPGGPRGDAEPAGCADRRTRR